MKCSILLASLAVATVSQPHHRNFHCSGEDPRGQRITVDGNLDVDPDEISPKRYVIGTVVVEKLDGEKSVKVFSTRDITAEFSARAMDLELRGTRSRVYIQTAPSGRARVTVRRSLGEYTDYRSECRFFNGTSVAVERATR